MPTIAQPIVIGPFGENRLVPDVMLPDNVSPDALNCDYSTGSIQKRAGFVKLNTESIKEGGVRVANTAQNACIYVHNNTDYDLDADFTIELFMKFMSTPTGTPVYLEKFVGGASGWQFKYQSANTRFQFQMYDSTPTLQLRNWSFPIVLGRRYHFALRRSSDVFRIVSINDDLTVDTSDARVITGSTPNTNPLFMGAVTSGGATPGNATADVIIDEVRIWTDVRPDAELLATHQRELNPTEVADTNLVGYWKMNDARWNTVLDISKNANHGAFFTAGPSFEPGLVPDASEDGYAIRFDGVDDSASTPWNSALVPILDTGNTWTFEGWCRIDKNLGATDQYVLCFGSVTGNDATLILRFDGTNLEFVFRTTTTHVSGTLVDTTFDPVVGEAFHFAIVRDGVDSIFTYINGELVDTETGVTAENGPTVDIDYGLYLGALNSDGTLSAYGAITLDEIRVWTTARSQTEVQDWMNRRYPDGNNSNLAGYWRFDAADKELDETGNASGGDKLVLSADGDKPEWERGLVYPQTAPRMLLCAPLSVPQRADEVRSGRNVYKREMLLCTHSDIWSIEGTTPNHLKRLESPGESGLFDWCAFGDYVVFTNGLDDNMKYYGGEIPRTLSIPQPTAALTDTPTGAGASWPLADGTYNYRYAYRNSKDGTESLGSDASGGAAMVGAIHDTCELSSITASTNAQVDKIRIYRKDPNTTTYRFLVDIDNGTTTFSDTGVDPYDDVTVAANDAINDFRGHAQPHKYCATYNNALFLLNTPTSPSRLTFSEVGKGNEGNIPATNFVDVDAGDGDEGTGIIAAFGGLVVFKQNSIHFLTGSGIGTYNIRKTVWGQGCVSAATIAPSPKGVYFLSHDGVYLMTDANTVIPVSFDQQTLFLTMDPDKLRFATGVYDHVQHVYVLSFDTGTKGPGAYVDKEPNLFNNYWTMGSDGSDSGTDDDTLSATGSPAHLIDAQRGACALFDGSADNYTGSMTSSRVASGIYTIGLWIKPSVNTPYTAIPLQFRTSATGSYSIVFIRGGTPPYQTRNSDTNSGGSGFANSLTPIAVDNWYHLVGTLVDDGSTHELKLYINGVLVATLSAATIAAEGASFTATVGSNGVGSNFFPGYIQNAFHIVGTALEDWQIAEIYEYESQAGFLQADRITMAYDEESEKWAKWDADFDCLEKAEFTQNRAEILGARGGFLYRLFDGLTDGSRIFTGGTTPISGSLTSQSSATINESGADFPTANDGLAGTPLLAVPTDTTQASQLRTIIGNDADDLYLNQGFSPAITGTYYVGPIQWHWESRWMDMTDPAVTKQLYKLFLHQREDSNANTVTAKHKTNEHETWVDATFTTADEWNWFVTENVGRLIKVRFQNLIPNQNVDLTGFQFIFEPTEVL